MSEASWRGAEGAWSFDDIGEPFDEHVRKHLPGYDLIEQLAVSTAMWNVTDGSKVLDIGCATGQTLALLRDRTRRPYTSVGIDPDAGMLDVAKQRCPEVRFHCCDFQIADLHDDDGDQKFDVVFALFALQFISPRDRADALDRVASLLAPGGLFILAEKCEAESPRAADLYQGIYADWKLQEGVSPDEVLAKWASLRGQLVPWRAGSYALWAHTQHLEGDLIWCWGPFRAWAWWSPALRGRLEL